MFKNNKTSYPVSWDFPVEYKHDLNIIRLKKSLLSKSIISIFILASTTALISALTGKGLSTLLDSSVWMWAVIMLPGMFAFFVIFIYLWTILSNFVIGISHKNIYSYFLTESELKVTIKETMSDGARKKVNLIKYAIVTLVIFGILWLLTEILMSDVSFATMSGPLTILAMMLAKLPAAMKSNEIRGISRIPMKRIFEISSTNYDSTIKIRGQYISFPFIYCDEDQESLLRHAHEKAAHTRSRDGK
ncbi:hypothetical protein [Burkholderia sp. 3C]